MKTTCGISSPMCCRCMPDTLPRPTMSTSWSSLIPIRSARRFMVVLTFIFRSEGDREQHFCFRVLAHSNAIAFQSRLRAAMTASGVDHALGFRRLFILRRDAPAGRSEDTGAGRKISSSRRQVRCPNGGNLHTFVALRAMLKNNHHDFDAWLRARKPLFDTPLFKAAELCPPSFLPPSPRPGNGRDQIPLPDPSPSPAGGDVTSPTVAPPQVRPPQHKADPANGIANASQGVAQRAQAGPPLSRDIPLGHRFERGAVGAGVTLSADLLPRHVAILAGSSRGRRCCCGASWRKPPCSDFPPSCSTPTTTWHSSGDPWPARPESWTDADAAKAADHRKKVDVVIWTPGLRRWKAIVGSRFFPTSQR